MNARDRKWKTQTLYDAFARVTRRAAPAGDCLLVPARYMDAL